MDNSKIEQLKQALSFSPNNIPLKLLLAQSLVDGFLFDEAVIQYKEVLQVEPNNQEASFSLSPLSRPSCRLHLQNLFWVCQCSDHSTPQTRLHRHTAPLLHSTPSNICRVHRL